ncbi:Acg family FMN-binding oxidoreductase [Catellatospora methionotrophica]|uniref:Acg family FMN-binding oxidoreductase n=1 Tax=Catellatospora methionotrophica TaxID=121620 RepID=UPI0033D38A4B
MAAYVPTRPLGASRDAQDVNQALADAAALAGYAPSIHNTQPWRWRLSADTLDLHLECSRLLAVTDPDHRLATLSCGAALDHARTGLAAQGWHATVTRLPDSNDPDHLARLQVDGRTPPDPRAAHLAQTILVRHTDRRPVTGVAVTAADLADITASVEAHDTWLHVLRNDQLYDLASAADHAQRVEGAQPQWRDELGQWTGGTRPGGTGIPDAAIPADNPQTPVPGRDFGHPGTMSVSTEHDRAAVFAMLYGRSDEPLGWLRAGEALSAGWLTATERGLTVLPISAPIEVVGTRQVLRHLVSDLGHPYLVIRLGLVDPTAVPAPHTPRLPAEQIIERS